jgi:ribulose-phosphate 3-epimerase
MPKLIPAILEKDADSVARKIDLLQTTSLDTIHLDVMDNLAVPNFSWGVAEVARYFRCKLEVHLMVKDPIAEAKKWLPLPNVVRVIARSEEIDDFTEYFRLVKNIGKIGLAIDPTTVFSEELLRIPFHNHILIMDVVSGFSGQQFHSSVLSRINAVKEHWPLATIGVDGGMNVETIPKVKDIGVHVINAASYFWNSDGFAKKILFIEN